MLLLRADNTGEAGPRLIWPTAQHVADQPVEFREDVLGVAITPGPGEAPPPGRLRSDDSAQQDLLPARPVFAGVGQQGVTGHESQMRRDPARVQWPVVDDARERVEPHRPATLPGTSAKIDVLVVEEEVGVEPAQFGQHLAAY